MHRCGRRVLVWLAPLAALGVALLPTLLHGFPRGHDWQLALTRIAEYGHAVADGQIPPYWTPNVYGGQGAPMFLFYSPLFLIAASLGAAVLGSVTAGGTLAIWVFAVAGFLAVSDLLRSLGAEGAGARVAAALLVLHPYLLTDSLLRNADAEFAALSLLALPLAGVVRMASGQGGGFARLAVGLMLAVLAHNLTALVTAGLVTAFGLVLLWDAERRVQIRFALATATGLLLSSWLWLPALGYRHLIRQDELTRGSLDFHSNFAPIFGWGSYSSVGVLPGLVLLASSAWLIKTRPDGISGRVAWLLATVSGVFLCLQSQLSTPIWDALPVLPLFQCPWRFQGPLAVCIAALAGLAWSRVSVDWPARSRLAMEWLFLAALILNAGTHLSNVRPLPDDARAQLATMLTPEGIRTTGLKVTVGDEYLPAVGVDPAALPYGPDRMPPLRYLGLAVSGATALAWIGLLIRRRRILTDSSSPTGKTAAASM